MEEQTRVLEYKCPCCNAGLHFGSDAQKLTCEYCGNTFDIDTVRAFNESQNPQGDEEFQWEPEQTESFSEDEESTLRAFQCPSCGGEILCDENTAASFCPYCENPTIMPTRLSGGLKPDGVIPFKTGKEDAKAAFLRLCKASPFFPEASPRNSGWRRSPECTFPSGCMTAPQISAAATRPHGYIHGRIPNMNIPKPTIFC